MKQAGIYSFVNLVNSKRYIGQAVDIDGRIKRHFRELKNGNDGCVKLQRAWNKYGYQNFVVETIISTKNNIPNTYLEVFLDFLEKIHIKENTSYKNGYNCTEGGGGGNTWMAHTPKEREKRIKELSERMSNNNPMSGKFGQDNPFYGRHHSDETKKKISDAQNNKGCNNPNYGHRWTQEQKDIQSIKLKKYFENKKGGTI